MRKVYTDAPLYENEDSTKLNPIREVELVDKDSSKAVVIFEETAYIVKSSEIYEKKD